ncbi:MAG: hypothetical protein A2Z52_00115 [Candidatus Moranbacteria bacterium RBG_19FT_COMBO_42_6]|nr:MAG: hypothetical protein A2Z52_00115 [Candidatus Moranbacteria bacterium RBG_19FT_COMBO_42_6]
MVSGSLPLAEELIIPDENSEPLKWENGKAYPDRISYDLCHCGQSKNKPFCDGTHLDVRFKSGN